MLEINKKEYWKHIPHTLQQFSVSNFGNIRNNITCKILRQYEEKGYRVVKLKTAKRVHRIVADVFLRNIGNHPFVNHINGDKYDNRVENLEWVTPKQNTEHALRERLFNPSETIHRRANQRKFTFDKPLDIEMISKIKKLHETGLHKEGIKRALLISIAYVDQVLKSKIHQ